ncbi:helix-turn-helix domain-containing protein [Aestuariicoccus sp. MJ-SS9]|uniref:helix-turn-helix domain-containing protein n=1 Tax=Aestuariicoccus sp. MJ-SS9 TaxID=3079855 RepID=UPI00290A257B|nr:helix-turn-helix domain-containing protein [Aestuariicoccus sp. MJ-SS9]MDU8914098.1 helix-turn-helix domain-containing protein [Aestuariicoccus sp. MJ-SS9]
MGITVRSEAAKLASHLRGLREAHSLTLAALAERSGISRASLSRIENAEVSPTAETLGRLATVYALPISQLLSPLEQDFQPVQRRASQAVWRDPEHAFERRSVSPPNGQLSVELIEGVLGAGQRIAYAAPAIPGQEHHVYVLSGGMEVTVEGIAHDLRAGDCLRYKLFGETVFRTDKTPCKYVIALS